MLQDAPHFLKVEPRKQTGEPRALSLANTQPICYKKLRIVGLFLNDPGQKQKQILERNMPSSNDHSVSKDVRMDIDVIKAHTYTHARKNKAVCVRARKSHNQRNQTHEKIGE